MLNKIEFSDLYKFLTSVGLIIIASSFLIPWLFMKQEVGLIITDLEYNELIESSRKLTDKRISLGLTITNAIPIISTILFILGLFISTVGIWKWKKKQDTVDETDQLNLTELKAKIKELDSNEVDLKAEEEVKSELSINSKPNKVNTVDNQKNTNIEELKSNLIDMENLFYSKIIDYNSFVYEPKSNVKIDDKYKIDILLNSLDINKHPDIIIEVKYIQNKLNITIVTEALKNLIKAYSTLHTTRKKVNAYLIIVYKKDIADSKEVNRFLEAVTNLSNKYPNDINIIAMGNEDTDSYNIKNIIK